MNLIRRFAVIVAMIVLLATAIEYGLITTSTSVSVATDGTIINQN